jgi:hypothetical protein
MHAATSKTVKFGRVFYYSPLIQLLKHGEFDIIMKAKKAVNVGLIAYHAGYMCTLSM